MELGNTEVIKTNEHSMISYRRADLALLKELLAVFGEAFDELETYQGAVPSDDYLRSLIDSDNFIALAAVADGAVVGGLAAYVLKSLSGRGLKFIFTIWPFAGSTGVEASQPD